MSRAGEEDVRNIITSDVIIDITAFIEIATTLVDYVDTCDTDNVLSSEQLKQIEILLSAHFYAHRDLQYTEKKTGDASAKFQVGAPGTGSLDTTVWGRDAMTVDVTGCLAALNEQAKTGRHKVGLAWLGKPPSDQTLYVDRD